MKVKIILFFILLWAKNLVNSLQIPKNVVGANVFLKLEKLKVTIGFHILKFMYSKKAIKFCEISTN